MQRRSFIQAVIGAISALFIPIKAEPKSYKPVEFDWDLPPQPTLHRKAMLEGQWHPEFMHNDLVYDVRAGKYYCYDAKVDGMYLMPKWSGSRKLPVAPFQKKGRYIRLGNIINDGAGQGWFILS